MKRLALAALLAAFAMPAAAEWSRYNLTITNTAGTKHFIAPYCEQSICKHGLSGIKLAVDHALVNELKFNALPVVGSLHFGLREGERADPEPVAGSCLYVGNELHCELQHLNATIYLELKSGKIVHMILDGRWARNRAAAGTWNVIAPKKKTPDPKGNQPKGT